MPLDETIFLTGFPGFIAGRLVKRLAIEGAQFMLLVLHSDMGRARKDVKSLIEETGAPAANFRILEGDITKPDLGLDPDALKKAQKDVTSLFHLAAFYDLDVKPGPAMRVNFEGTRNVNQFARGLDNLRRYHYVSTCYVAGLRRGMILETELRHEAGFRNHYEETKYLAEVEVDALKEKLPITIYRPSVVCGDSHTGETAKYDGIYYLIHYLRKWPWLLSLFNIGNREVRLNLVPVDFVIEAITALAKDERSVGATLQLADPNPLTTYDLFEMLAQAIAGRGSRVTIPSSLVYGSLRLPLAPLITGLPRSGVPYFFLDQTYDTTRAQELLEPHGVRCPPLSDYVHHLVEFVDRHPKL